jgi:hypothetical protein
VERCGAWGLTPRSRNVLSSTRPGSSLGGESRMEFVYFSGFAFVVGAALARFVATSVRRGLLLVGVGAALALA